MYVWMRLSENFSYAWSYLASGRVLATVLGVAFALLAIGLFIASRTRWGQSKPLTKCVLLAVLAHIWMLIYAWSTHLQLPQGDRFGSRQALAIALDATFLEPELPDPTAQLAMLNADPVAPAPWEALTAASSLPIDDLLAGRLSAGVIDPLLDQPSQLPPLPPEETDPLPAPELATTSPSDSVLPDSLPAENAEAASLAAAPAALQPEPALPLAAQQPQGSLPDLNPTELRQPELSPADPTPTALNQPVASQLDPPSAAQALPDQPALATLEPPPAQLVDVPAEYRLRRATNRLELARPFGADEDTEAAVSAALQWLAAAQSDDGSWNAKRYGAGTETFALGENRRGTGERADTGISGMALLAFLSGGHTHLEGEHRLVVQRALEYLIRVQMPSGDLSGPLQIGNDPAVVNARMYCHGIATLALAEAYALTHDAALHQPLTRAIRYTLAAQDPRGGGWRYRPGDPGDLSQFGWQAMALRSAERSGLRVEPVVHARMKNFLTSCATGPGGGLARYRPHEGAPSPTMTSEALACRLLLGVPLSGQGLIAARQNLLEHLPGTDQDNVYYWYYATLALFQLQDSSWQTWNIALKKRLLETQVPVYHTDGGSWTPDEVWGGYGGRVYQTAMSCMCLEVYYRYLPLYQPSNTARVPTASSLPR
jgi:hypothetical protein